MLLISTENDYPIAHKAVRYSVYEAPDSDNTAWHIFAFTLLCGFVVGQVIKLVK